MWTVILASLVISTGCVSPLKSDDQAERLNAVANVSDEKELFLIAMNVGASTFGSGAQLYEERYHSDVRLAAVKRLSAPALLLKCATWSDGDTYSDPGVESGTFSYRGNDYRVYNREDLKARVSQMEEVHTAAIKRLTEAEVFVRLPAELEKYNRGMTSGESDNSIRTGLFPGKPRYADKVPENAFVDYYGCTKKNNPLDRVLTRIVKEQKDQVALCDFIIASREYGPNVYPNAIDAAIEILDGSCQKEIAETFVQLFLNDEKLPWNPRVSWGWKLLEKMDAPPESVLCKMVSLGYGNNEGAMNRAEVNRIAELKFTDAMWAKCYLEKLFDGYPRSRMVSNIKSTDELAKFLIAAKEINVKDAEAAISRVDDISVLEGVKRDCYLKVIAEKSEAKLFMLTYPKRLDSISKMNSKLDRAIAANSFKKLLDVSDVDQNKKRKLNALLVKWIEAGVDQIIATCKANKATVFSVAGFYPGMKNDEARMLFDYRYPEEEISWNCNDKGLVERFNFGTTFLAKIYKFDANTWSDWIRAYSRLTGCRFVLDELKDERKPIGGRGTVIKVSQKVWRCQDNRRDVTISYFGDKNVQEIEPEAEGFVESVFKMTRGVTGGDIIKEVVLEGSRNWANNRWEQEVGGYPGMLRIERGTVGPGGTRKINQPTSKNSIDRASDSVTDTLNALKDAAPAVENFMNNLMK